MNPAGRSRWTSSIGFSVLAVVVSFRRPKRRLLTVVEIPGAFSVVSLFSVSGDDSDVAIDDVALAGVGRCLRMKGEGLREGLSAASLAMAFVLGVTNVFLGGNLDLKVDASLIVSDEVAVVVVRNLPGRVGRTFPGMNVLFVFTSERTTFRVVSLDSVVVDDDRPRSVVKNLR